MLQPIAEVLPRCNDIVVYVITDTCRHTVEPTQSAFASEVPGFNPHSVETVAG